MPKYDDVLNAQIPRLGNRITRAMGRGVLKLMGWEIKGSFPPEPKAVFIGLPHTSNWDFILFLSSMQAVGLKASWMMKKEAFFWPLGGLFKKLGGVPIDRQARISPPKWLTGLRPMKKRGWALRQRARGQKLRP